VCFIGSTYYYKDGKLTGVYSPHLALPLIQMAQLAQ